MTTTAPTRSRPSPALIQKMALQSAMTRTRAPSTGPSTDPSSCTAPTTPSGTPRRSGGQSWATIARVAGTSPPPPTPWTTRPLTSTGSSTASAVITEPDDEDAETTEEHPLAVDEVGDPADERKHRDVAEEEARDDRCRPLEGIDAHADAAHHVGEGQDDDVGVRRGEGDGDRGRREERPRGG